MLHYTMYTMYNYLFMGLFRIGLNNGCGGGRSATCADIIDDFCNSSIFTTKFTTN